MPPQRILDSHIHLWPSTATSTENHAWMTPGNFLAKRHGIADYLAVANPKPEGFVYVETDRYLPSSAPDLPKDNDWEYRRIIELWAKEPLEEIRFLRRIVEGKTEEGDGVKGDHGSLMKGVVLYAPFHFNGLHLRAYMDMAEEVAGPKLWSRVVGFRYLLQGKGDGVVERMLAGDRPNSKSVRWMSNFRHLKKGNEGKGRCFDVGVDTHRDGMGPFEALAEFMHEMRYWEKTSEIEGTPVTFILNHLGKPPLSKQPDPRWLQGMETLGADKNIYMKLSGAFNEFDEDTPSDVPTLLKSLTPFLEHVFKCFPNRVMFGSDWPVCNVGGPKGEEGNWSLWQQVVEAWMETQGFGEQEKESVWWKAGCEAYKIEM